MTRESHFPGDDSSTRDRILNAAMHLFAERGYGATPIKAIARACNMSDAGVFHHFATKRDILEALLDRPHERMEGNDSVEPVRDERSMDNLVLRTLDAAHVNEPILRVLIRQQLVSDPEAMAARDMALKNWRSDLKECFGHYRREDAEVLAEAFSNAVMGWLFLMQVRHGAAVVEMLLDEHVRSEVCAHVRRAVPLDRFVLRDRQHRRMENEGIS